MRISVSNIIDYFNEKKSQFPISLLYSEYNSSVYKKINSLIKIIRDKNIELLRLSKLSLNLSSHSFFLDMFHKAIRHSIDFIKKKKIILIDCFFPFHHTFNVECVEIVNFISKFDNIDSKINKYNTILILGMRFDQYDMIPIQNSMMRRYKGLELYIDDTIDNFHSTERNDVFKFDKVVLPTKDMSSILNTNPLYHLINKQLKSVEDVNNTEDAVINLIKLYQKIDLKNIKKIFRQLFTENIEKDDLSIFFNDQKKNINYSRIQSFNIKDLLVYLNSIPEIFEIDLNPEDKKKIFS